MLGLWTASMHLGNFVGPTLSGFMVEAWGFRQTTTVFLIAFAIMALIDFEELVRQTVKGRRRGYEEIEA